MGVPAVLIAAAVPALASQVPKLVRTFTNAACNIIEAGGQRICNELKGGTQPAFTAFPN